MDKRKISEDVYERYVDASVALFMEYYAASCLDGSNSPHADGKDFPADLDTRCRALINRECTRQRRRAFLKSAGKCLGAVACLAIFMLSLSSVLFMTVEAVRIPIINYYINEQNGYWEISGEVTSNSTQFDAIIDYTNPLRDSVPNEYRLKTVSGDSLSYITAVYENDSKDQIILYTQPSGNYVTIDSENSSLSQKCQIGGYDIVLVQKNGDFSLTWFHPETGIIFTIATTGVEQSLAINITEQFIHALTN